MADYNRPYLCETAGCGRRFMHAGPHRTSSGWQFDTEAEYRARTAWHPPTKDPATIAHIIDQHATANEQEHMSGLAAANRQVGRNIRAELARIGSNQGKAAEHIGITQAGMSDRVNGRTPWRVQEVLQLANLAGVPVARLLDGVQ